MPQRVAAFTPNGLLAAMPGYADGVLAAKLVSVFPGHEPSHQALIAVIDPETGTPLAVMDGAHITAVRTGALAASPEVAGPAQLDFRAAVLHLHGRTNICPASAAWPRRAPGTGWRRRCLNWFRTDSPQH